MNWSALDFTHDGKIQDKKKKKDPLEEIPDILESYEEGTVPRTGKDYEM